MKGDVGWTPQHILVRLIIRGDRVAMREAEKIKLSKFTNKVTGIVRHIYTFQNIIKTILNFAIACEKEYKEKFVAARSVNIVEETMATDFLTRMSTQFYYRFIRVAIMTLRHESILALVEGLNGDDVGSNSLGISHLDDIKIYTPTTEELPILNTAARSFVKDSNKLAPFYMTTLYTSEKKFFEELRAVFVIHRTEPAS